MTTQGQTAEDTINLGLGVPSTSLLPLDLVQKHVPLVLNTASPEILQYGFEPGSVEFRQTMAHFLNEVCCLGRFQSILNFRQEMKLITNEDKQFVKPEELFITAGISSALALVCNLFSSE